MSEGATWTVYVLCSLKNRWFYIGLTNDLLRRVREHNRGYNRSTKGKGPFKIVHAEAYSTRAGARAREKYLKSGVGREYLRRLLR